MHVIAGEVQGLAATSANPQIKSRPHLIKVAALRNIRYLGLVHSTLLWSQGGAATVGIRMPSACRGRLPAIVPMRGAIKMSRSFMVCCTLFLTGCGTIIKCSAWTTRRALSLTLPPISVMHGRLPDVRRSHTGSVMAHRRESVALHFIISLPRLLQIAGRVQARSMVLGSMDHAAADSMESEVTTGAQVLLQLQQRACKKARLYCPDLASRASTNSSELASVTDVVEDLESGGACTTSLVAQPLSRLHRSAHEGPTWLGSVIRFEVVTSSPLAAAETNLQGRVKGPCAPQSNAAAAAAPPALPPATPALLPMQGAATRGARSPTAACLNHGRWALPGLGAVVAWHRIVQSAAGRITLVAGHVAEVGVPFVARTPRMGVRKRVGHRWTRAGRSAMSTACRRRATARVTRSGRR